MTSLSVLSWNVWLAGTPVEHAVQKQLAVLREHLTTAEAPVLLLQEAGDVARDLAGSLGWNLVSAGDTAILSPLPLTAVNTVTGIYACAAIAETASGPVLMWSAHLEHRDYGPYFASAAQPERVLDLIGERRRAEQAGLILAETNAEILRHGGKLPVIIGGDFNVPATGDWRAGRDAAAVNAGLRWAATDLMLEAGYTDTFRAVWPDPALTPAPTWSMIEPYPNEPRDRIDFVFSRGFTVADARNLGAVVASEDPSAEFPGDEIVRIPGPAAHIPAHRENAWPSDHLAVLATLEPSIE